MKPHKHAELIKAWADGAEIEVYQPALGRWEEAEPAWHTSFEYRIKPAITKNNTQSHPINEPTDEEIYRLLADSIWAVGLNTDCLDEQNWADGITVARAILRKRNKSKSK